MMDKSNNSETGKLGRVTLDLKWDDYRWPLFFLLSMSMMGLMFPLGYLLVPIILIERFRKDRYDFIIMMTIFMGGFGYISEGILPVKTEDIALLVSAAVVCLYRKSPIIKKTLLLLLAYAACLLIIAKFSTESMMIQIRTWRYYMLFIYFIVPIAAFSGEEFDIRVFFRRLFPYVFVTCAFYIIDGFIINGFIFLPTTPIWGGSAHSTFLTPYAHPFSIYFVRKYPQGLILLAMCIYPMAKYYKLKPIEWVLIIGACAASRTFTVISGFLVGYMVCAANARTILKYIGVAAVVLAALYYIDSFLPTTQKTAGIESFLRVKSSIDQVFALGEVQDDVDLSALASGRSAQILPKLELVSSLGKQWTGLGFLHSELTTNTDYIINNEYYIDVEKSEEVATGIECEPFQVYVSVGILGLIAYFGFYVMLNVFVKNYRYARYFLSMVIMVFWFSLGAYGGLTNANGLVMVALAYSAILLEAKRNGQSGQAV